MLDAETTKTRKSHGVSAQKTIVVRWFYKRDSCWTDSFFATVVEPIQKTNRSNNCRMVWAGQIHPSHQPTDLRPITVQNVRDALLTQIRDPLSAKMAKVDAEHKTWARQKVEYPSGSLSASTVVGRRVWSRWPSRGVGGQPMAVAWCERVIRRSSSLRTTIVVPTKIAWCVPSFKYANLYLNLAGSLPEVLVANFACLPTRCYLDEILVEHPFTLFGNVLPCLLMCIFPSFIC